MGSWGRWGDGDELGALNLLGAEQVRRGMAAVRDGVVVPLAAPIVAGRGFGVAGRPAPVHYMARDGGDYVAGRGEQGGFGYADDVVMLPTHGATHVDALSHVWREGRMYNGYPATDVSSRGARRLGVHNIRPIVTRGVFVDSAPGGYRDAGDRIDRQELAGLLAAADVRLESGDALLVRTGWLAEATAGRGDARAWPGLYGGCGPWLAEQ